MSDVVVEKQIVMRSLDSIRPYEHNPRKNDKTVELLCKIIPKVGFNVPIVIDVDGVIVKGHARYLAAKRLGMKEVPCIITHADKDTVRADRIADNKISEFSEWVYEELMHEVDMLDMDFDLTDLGLPKVSFDDIPTADEFETDVKSDEERQRLYQEFLERQAKENAVEVKMTSEAAMKAALIKQANTPKPARDYAQCTCKRCGHIMYVDRNVLYGPNGVVRR